MKLAFRLEGMIAMHFAPDMIPSGMARSGADMIWVSTVLAVCTRSICAPRFWDQVQVVIEQINNAAARIFFMARLRSKQCGPPARAGCTHLTGVGWDIVREESL